MKRDSDVMFGIAWCVSALISCAMTFLVAFVVFHFAVKYW